MATDARRRHTLRSGALAVLVGGLAGSAVRVGVSEVVPAAGGWPVATLTVNLAGALLLGAFLARREQAVVRPWSVELWAIGALGSLTTFSAFGVETVLLLDAGRTGVALSYVLASTVGGTALARIGDLIGRRRR